MMLQHTHKWLGPPYLYTSAELHHKHKLARWQQSLIILAAVVLPFLIPLMLTFWYQLTPIILGMAFVFSVLLTHFRKSFFAAITLAVVPFFVFYWVTGLPQLYSQFADYRTATMRVFTLSLISVLTVYYAVILEAWQNQINYSPVRFWPSIRVATGILAITYGFLPFAMLSQNLIFVVITGLVGLYVPFVPPTFWVAKARIYAMSAEVTSEPASNDRPNRTSTIVVSESPNATETADLAPYKPIEFYLVGLVLGVVGTAVMALVNARRMRQQKGIWLVIAIAILIYFSSLGQLDLFIPLSWWGLIASILFVIGVVEWQKPNYRLWLHAHNDQPPTWSERGGWLWFGAVVGSVLILNVLLGLLMSFVQPLVVQADFLIVPTIGCVITLFGPVIYDLLTREPLRLKQMLLYTAGWLVSLPFSAIYIFGGILASDGWSGNGSLRDAQLSILVYSSLTYIPIIFVSLIIGWVLFQRKHYLAPRLFMLLPLINVMIYIIMMLTIK